MPLPVLVKPATPAIRARPVACRKPAAVGAAATVWLDVVAVPGRRRSETPRYSSESVQLFNLTYFALDRAGTTPVRLTM